MANEIFDKASTANLQRYLRQLSYHCAAISPPPIDGVWESATERSLSEFQKEHALPVTGRADKITWDRLREEYLRSMAENSPPTTVSLFPREKGFSVSEGDEGLLAELIIYMLGELSATYGFPVLPEARVIDADLTRIIADFQEKNGLQPSGKVDRMTWDALAREHNLLEGGKYN